MRTRTERIANYSRYRGVMEVIPDAVSPDASQRNECNEIAETDAMSIPKPAAYSAWEDFLATSGPYPYMWTQSFVRPYSDNELFNALWQCTRFINRELWGPRWDRKQLGLKGTVVAEPHRKSLDVRGRLHFHVLLHGQQGNGDLQRLREVVTSASLRLRDSAGRQMSAIDRVNVKEVWDIGGLADYLTKDLQTPHWAGGDNIFFIRPNGIEGNVMQARSSAMLKRFH